MGAAQGHELQNAHGTYTAEDAQLFDCACDDDLGRIRQLLAAGAQPDKYRHQVVSARPPPAAKINGHPEPQRDAQTADTAFARACRNGHVACAQELANAGCDTSLSPEARADWDRHRLGALPTQQTPARPHVTHTLGAPPQRPAPVPAGRLPNTEPRTEPSPEPEPRLNREPEPEPLPAPVPSAPAAASLERAGADVSPIHMCVRQVSTERTFGFNALVSLTWWLL
jgi:hypothetical protein